MGSLVRTIVCRVVVAVPLLLAGLALTPVVAAADVGVDIAGFAFSPQTITVHVGDTVTWSNADVQSHTATADNGAWNTGTITGGSSMSVTLSTAGTFAYHCNIHRTMTATLVVQAAAGSGGGTPPPTDAEPAPGQGGAPWPLLGLVAVIGLEIGRRRFAER
jgi:plastocyanin